MMKKCNHEIAIPSQMVGHTLLGDYRKIREKKKLVIVLLLLAILFLSAWAITLGPMDITLGDVGEVLVHKICATAGETAHEKSIMNAIWLGRLPRVLTALVAGFGLAVAGAVMQSILRNPLASPFTLGISSGAGFGAALAIILGQGIGSGSYYIMSNAFLGSMVSSLIIVVLAKKQDSSPEMMILIGVALSYFFAACTTVMQYFADSWATKEVIFWIVGSLSKGTWETLGYMCGILLLGVPYLICKAWDLNSLSIGDDAAKSIGVQVERTRMTLMIVTSLITASIICFTGAIGFIGLLAPHVTRMICGSDNRFVIPASGLVGALLLLVADLVARTILAPVILPIGIMTSFVGVPLLVYLVVRMRRGFCS
jgi:iron complex transport system permease protein